MWKVNLLRLVSGLIPVTQGEITLSDKKIGRGQVNRGMVFKSIHYS